MPSAIWSNPLDIADIPWSNWALLCVFIFCILAFTPSLLLLIPSIVAVSLVVACFTAVSIPASILVVSIFANTLFIAAFWASVNCKFSLSKTCFIPVLTLFTLPFTLCFIPVPKLSFPFSTTFLIPAVSVSLPWINWSIPLIKVSLLVFNVLTAWAFPCVTPLFKVDIPVLNSLTPLLIELAPFFNVETPLSNVWIPLSIFP